jgi:S-adenosylmethionine:tRNA ribosyltransferase-isomerase
MRRPADAQDAERYQTVFAEVPGAVAAPTAGLHFTTELLGRLPHTFITLHVGTGTFAPVQNGEHRRAHDARGAVLGLARGGDRDQPRAADRCRGTTSVRVLEGAERVNGQLVPQDGRTNIFIHPPHLIRHVDALLTNFHLPRSTLLMLVSAFAGREFVLEAYAEAIRERYRFYSYGDCMLIL